MGLTKVSTDGVKDDAITKSKIPANQIEASELADNAVDTNAIADQAVSLSKLPHGTSSNDGKFLRANNGADPSFETVSIPAGTTINNNADNRVITGSGTANTLNGESGLLFDSSQRLLLGNSGSRNVGGSTTNSKIQIEGTSTNTSSISLVNNEGSTAAPFIFFGKTRGNSVGESGIVQNGDTLGGLSFIGADSVDTNNRTAEITAKVNGTPSNNTIPTDLTFSTSAQNASQLAERMRITSAGNVGIGTTNPVRHMHLNGSDSNTVQLHITNSTTGTTGSDGVSFALGSDESLIINQRESNHIALKTADTERMRIDSSGRLGIGTSSPSHKFQVADSNTAIGFSRNGQNAQIIFDSNLVTNCGIIEQAESSGGGEMKFFTKDTGGTLRERARFLTGGGITFNGDTASANAFDDYETGTFTLNCVSGGFSGVAGTGRYTKIGRTVIFNGDFSLQGSGGGGTFRLNGLPFVSWDWNSLSGYFQHYGNEGSQQACFAVVGNTNDIGVIEFGNEMAGSTVSAGYMNIAGCYQTT